MISSYLVNQRKGTFRHVFLCYKPDEPLYAVLQDQLKDNITVFKDLATVPSCAVESFPDQPDHEILFVFDDIVLCNEKDKKNLQKLENYYAFSRKKGITTFFLTQSYYQTHKFLRDNKMTQNACRACMASSILS